MPKIPRSQQILQDELNDSVRSGENIQFYPYTNIAQELGPYYDAVFDQVGTTLLENIYDHKPELLRRLRPINYQDHTVKCLQSIVNSRVKILSSDSLTTTSLKSTGQVIGLAGADGNVYYTLVTDN